MPAANWLEMRLPDRRLDAIMAAAARRGVEMVVWRHVDQLYLEHIKRMPGIGVPGSGAASIRELLAYARRERLPVRLWTEGKRLIAYYKALGFVVTEKKTYANMPPDADMEWRP
jgi:hypothetical protein